MKMISAILFSFLALGAQHGAQLMTGVVSSHGITAHFETRLETGSMPMQRHGGGSMTEGYIIKRHLCNFDNRACSGYDLTMEALPDGRVRLRFAKLTITPKKMSQLFKEVPKWTVLPLPARPATMDVRVGETVALDLFANASTGQRVREYLTISSAGDRKE